MLDYIIWTVGVLIIIGIIIKVTTKKNKNRDIISRGKARGGFLGWCCSKLGGGA